MMFSRILRFSLFLWACFLNAGGGVARAQQAAPLAAAPTTKNNRSLSDRWHQIKQQFYVSSNSTETMAITPTVSSTEQSEEDVMTPSNEQKLSAELSKAKTAHRKQQAVLKPEDVTFLTQAVVFSVALLAFSAWIDPTTAVATRTFFQSSLGKELRQASFAAFVVNTLSFLYHHASSFGPMLITLWAQHDLWQYLWDTVLPTLCETTHTMMTNELWNRFFARVYGILGTMVVSAVYTATGVSPVPMKSSSFFMTALKRGTRRLFQRPLQRQLQAALSTVATFVVTTLRTQIASLWGGFFSTPVAVAA